MLKAAEFEETFNLTEKVVTPVAADQAIPMRFSLEFPVSAPEGAYSVFSIAHASGSGDFVLYSGPARRHLDIEVNFPHRPDHEYPNGGYLQVSLFLPKQRAICNWGGEELILLETAEHPRAIKVKLLADSYQDDEGTIRRTVISPL